MHSTNELPKYIFALKFSARKDRHIHTCTHIAITLRAYYSVLAISNTFPHRMVSQDRMVAVARVRHYFTTLNGL